MDIPQLRKVVRSRGHFGILAFLPFIFLFLWWKLPLLAVLAAIVLGRFWGELAYADDLGKIWRKLERMHMTVNDRVQKKIDEYIDIRHKVDVSVHKSASEACSALAGIEAEEQTPDEIYGEGTEFAKMMSMKPGDGSAIALSPFSFDLEDDEEKDKE